MAVLNVDLHCHSNLSDGALDPEAVVLRAKGNGVDLLALTDHDSVEGLARAAAQAQACDLRFIPGVEVSVTWEDETIHIVGLNIDPVNAALLQGLDRVRNGRLYRAQEIAEQLAQVGVPGAFEGAMKYCENLELLGRTHFARFLVEKGVCASVKEVFQNYLVEGKPGYVPHTWARLQDALAWIHGAGGAAVIAHPGRYPLADACLERLVAEFAALGGQGIEVISGSHTPLDVGRYAGLSKRHGLLASRASDFHAVKESGFDLGRMPDLPQDVSPVWALWA